MGLAPATVSTADDGGSGGCVAAVAVRWSLAEGGGYSDSGGGVGTAPALRARRME